MGRDGYFVNKGGTEELDSTAGGKVIPVTGNGNGPVKSADKGGDGLAGLERVAVATKRGEDLETNMAGADEDVLRITDPEIDVADIGTIGGDNAKVVGGNEFADGVAGNNMDKT